MSGISPTAVVGGAIWAAAPEEPFYAPPNAALVILVLWPDIELLFISGDTENTIVQNGVLEHGVAFMAKPITPETLLRKVREVLGPAS